MEKGSNTNTDFQVNFLLGFSDSLSGHCPVKFKIILNSLKQSSQKPENTQLNLVELTPQSTTKLQLFQPELPLLKSSFAFHWSVAQL